MIKPYEPPSFEIVKAWRSKLLEACAKLETFPASELQTATVMLVSDVAHQMQGALMDYGTWEEREHADHAVAHETAKNDALPGWKKRPDLTQVQARWMLTRILMGSPDVSKRAMAEWEGEIEPDPAMLNPPSLIRGG